jgi:hypothetical protein
MPELDLHSRSCSGYPFESPHLDVEIYRLITTVAASRVFAEGVEDEHDGLKWEWYKRIELPEVSRLLVSISAIARNSIDADRGADGAQSLEADTPVGILVPNTDYPDRQEGLEFRNACNKILHADQINPGVEDSSRGLMSALEPRVYLYGEYRGSKWRASVDIYDFAMVAGSLC